MFGKVIMIKVPMEFGPITYIFVDNALAYCDCGSP